LNNFDREEGYGVSEVIEGVDGEPILQDVCTRIAPILSSFLVKLYFGAQLTVQNALEV
jgi:hypothetical protein